MNSGKIASARLANQYISSTSSQIPKELVGDLGAMQAQSYKWIKWAIGLRLPEATLETVEEAIADGDLIRTHLLRPTWHMVAAKDLRWMLELTAPRVRVAMRSGDKRLGLTDEVISQTNAIIEKALVDEDYVTRDVLVAILEDAGFENKDNLASHLLVRAELDGVICSGPTDGKHHTFALFEKRVPSTDARTKEESLKRLATLYFTSHGPATLDDFTWWSGLTKTTARQALEMIQPDFESFKTDSKIYWFNKASIASAQTVYLLPAYDEFIISYTDRSAVLKEQHYKNVISMNGIFKPVIVVDGMVAGIWKRRFNKKSIKIETQFFEQPNSDFKDRVEEAASHFTTFYSKELQIEHTVY